MALQQALTFANYQLFSLCTHDVRGRYMYKWHYYAKQTFIKSAIRAAESCITVPRKHGECIIYVNTMC